MKRREFIELSSKSLGGLLIYSLAGEPLVVNAEEGKVKVPLRFFTEQEAKVVVATCERIFPAILHLVRNAVDHGFEPPEVREARGKPVEGCLKMRAYHEGGQVTIEIADDGGGVDFERVRQKAMQRGLINLEQAARMWIHRYAALWRRHYEVRRCHHHRY